MGRPAAAQPVPAVLDRGAMNQLGSNLRFVTLGSVLAVSLALGCQKAEPEPESKPAAEPAIF